jgi:hypothetical protein
LLYFAYAIVYEGDQAINAFVAAFLTFSAAFLTTEGLGSKMVLPLD